MLGVGVGMGVFGGPVLPCAVKVRRKVVERYEIDEGYAGSVVHVCCCPGAALIQMLMQVEEEEGGRVGLCGFWKEGRYSGEGWRGGDGEEVHSVYGWDEAGGAGSDESGYNLFEDSVGGGVVPGGVAGSPQMKR